MGPLEKLYENLPANTGYLFRIYKAGSNIMSHLNLMEITIEIDGKVVKRYIGALYHSSNSILIYMSKEQEFSSSQVGGKETYLAKGQ